MWVCRSAKGVDSPGGLGGRWTHTNGSRRGGSRCFGVAAERGWLQNRDGVARPICTGVLSVDLASLADERLCAGGVRVVCSDVVIVSSVGPRVLRSLVRARGGR